jgi:hypothetical protein
MENGWAWWMRPAPPGETQRRLHLWLLVAQGVFALLLLAAGISIGDTRLIWAPIALFVITILMYWHDQRIARR